MPKNDKTLLPKARPMTRGELKALRAAGLDISTPFDGPDEAKAQRNWEMLDWILDNCYPGIDFDAVPYPECISLASETYRLTFKDEKAEKNS